MFVQLYNCSGHVLCTVVFTFHGVIWAVADGEGNGKLQTKPDERVTPQVLLLFAKLAGDGKLQCIQMLMTFVCS
jgi:hypothetical protein